MNIKSTKPQGPPPPTLDQQLQKAAKMYEQQFLQEMMSAMRKTVVATNEPSMAEKIYKDEMNDMYVEKWADSGGNGLADMIYKELKEKILPSQHSRYVNSGQAPQPKKIGDEIKASQATQAVAPHHEVMGPVPNESIKK